MRYVCTSVVVVCLTAGAATGHAIDMPLPSPTDDSADQHDAVSTSGEADRARVVLEAARAAIAAASAANPVRTLTIAGRTTRAVGPMQLVSAVDLHIALPHRYVRIDRLSMAGSRVEIASGFDGASLIQRARSGDGIRMNPETLLPAGARDAARITAVLGAKQDLAILLLGFLADSFPFYPLQFASAGTAEAPDGSADVVIATGANGFSVRLFVDTRTKRPLMASWSAPDALAAARQLVAEGRTTAPSLADVAALGSASMVEHRLHFESPRSADGVTWPSIVRRSVAGKPVEEWHIERIAVNAGIDDRVFEMER